MSLEIFTEIFRIASITLLVLITLLIVKSRHRYQHTQIGIFFIAALLAYLLLDSGRIREPFLFFPLLTGAFALPFLFWLLSKSVFSDAFRVQNKHFGLLIGIIIFYFLVFIQNRINYLHLPTGHPGNLIIPALPQMVSLTFVILAIAEAYKGKATDLLENRLWFRNVFILVSSALIIITLMMEVIIRNTPAPESLELLQKASIFLLILFFAYQRLEFTPGFFNENEKPTEKRPVDEGLLYQLNRLLNEEKIYRQEGLTITRLAVQMNTKEYKLRRLINQHLGFRNFNDFLNAYRIQEACEILLDLQKSDMTILEIAYSLGYQSLGPFNKAFRQYTQTTPTDYRKSSENKKNPD